MEESSLGAELDDSFTEFASINARGYILGAIRRGETEQDARKHVSGILAKYADVSRDFQIQEVDQRFCTEARKSALRNIPSSGLNLMIRSRRHLLSPNLPNS
jgi:hypothetical protein